jgi:hypothetical protein
MIRIMGAFWLILMLIGCATGSENAWMAAVVFNVFFAAELVVERLKGKA